jgi:GNAT superfamily N-acetyltransferase
MPEAVAPPRYRLRPATAGDFALLHALHVATLKEYVAQTWRWDDAAQAARFRARFRPETSRIVAVDDREVGALAVERRSAALFIANIAIVPEQQGHRLGAAIIGDVLAEAARMGSATRLQTLRVNPARRPYERLGFAIEGETPTHSLLRADPHSQTAPPLQTDRDGEG